MEQTYTSLIIRKRDVGEMDRLYSLLTLERGKMQVLAKSVRKQGAKLAGLLENFTLADVTVARSRGTGKITGSIVENNFSFLKNDYDALENIFANIHVINRITELENEDPRLFHLVKEYLEVVDMIVRDFGKTDEVKKKRLIALISAGFMAKAADTLGYAIETKRCAYCQGELSVQDNGFDAHSGGVVCRECVQHVQCLVYITHNGIKALRIFSHSSLASLVKLRIEDRDVRHVRGALTEFFRWIS